MIFCSSPYSYSPVYEIYSSNLIDHKHTLLIWAEWSFYMFQMGTMRYQQQQKTQHTTETILNSNWWDEEMRYVHSPPSSPLIAHIIFPSCMTRASSQLIYAAFLLFVKVLRRSWKTPPPTTLIFFVCMYLSEFFFFFFRDGSSCCLLVVVKGDVDCI